MTLFLPLVLKEAAKPLKYVWNYIPISSSYLAFLKGQLAHNLLECTHSHIRSAFIRQGSHTTFFWAPWGSGLITHDIVKFLILRTRGDSPLLETLLVKSSVGSSAYSHEGQSKTMFLESQAENSASYSWIEALLFWASICTYLSSLSTTPSITAEICMALTPHRYPNQVSLSLAWVEDRNAIQELLCSESDRAQTPDFKATCWIQGIFYAINNGMIGITLPPQNSEEWNPKSRG